MSGLRERFRRERKQAQQDRLNDMVREGEVVECTECHNIYPWSKVRDFSTQERYEVLCVTCITSHTGGHLPT